MSKCRNSKSFSKFVSQLNQIVKMKLQELKDKDLVRQDWALENWVKEINAMEKKLLDLIELSPLTYGIEITLESNNDLGYKVDDEQGKYVFTQIYRIYYRGKEGSYFNELEVVFTFREGLTANDYTNHSIKVNEYQTLPEFKILVENIKYLLEPKL